MRDPESDRDPRLREEQAACEPPGPRVDRVEGLDESLLLVLAALLEHAEEEGRVDLLVVHEVLEEHAARAEAERLRAESLDLLHGGVPCTAKLRTFVSPPPLAMRRSSCFGHVHCRGMPARR
jgi:hypothetical protein